MIFFINVSIDFQWTIFIDSMKWLFILIEKFMKFGVGGKLKSEDAIFNSWCSKSNIP